MRVMSLRRSQFRFRLDPYRIPQGLQDAMSRQARAERERQARVIRGQAEAEISDKFVQAAAAYTEKSNSPASSSHEHAVRSHPGTGFAGDRAVVSGRVDGGSVEPWQPRRSAEQNPDHSS